VAGAHSAIAASILNLAQGALHTMMIAKIKVAGMIATLALFTVGAIWGVLPLATERADAAPAQPVAFVQEKKKDEAGAKKDEPGAKKDGDRNNKDDILCLIKEIDLKVGSITVTYLRENMRGDGTYSLADKKLKITSSRREELTTKDLQIGARVHLALKANADVASIIVENPQFFGSLGSIDANTRMVELRAERKISTATVASDAKIVVFGKPAKLAEVPLNERSQFVMSMDRKTILSITVGKAGGRPGQQPKGEGDRPAPKIEGKKDAK
jgi:hypothetical protein